MKKKLICLMFMSVMLFSLTACVPQTIQPAVPQTIQPETIQPAGYFYDLATAYEQGWITKDDLKKIAYLNNGEVSDDIIDQRLSGGWIQGDFNPEPKIPQSLTAETEDKIKEAYVRELRKLPEYSEASTEDVSIYGYCGTYNDYVAIMITDSYHTYNGNVQTNFELDGVHVPFIYLNVIPTDINLNGIFVWKTGQTDEFYDLKAAYDQGLLSKNDLENISHYQRKNYVENWKQSYTYTPKPKPLSTETERKMQQTLLDLDGRPEAKLKEMYIGFYLGTYNGYVVTFRGAWFMGSQIVIGDVLFMFGSLAVLTVWKENI